MGNTRKFGIATFGTDVARGVTDVIFITPGDSQDYIEDAKGCVKKTHVLHVVDLKYLTVSEPMIYHKKYGWVTEGGAELEVSLDKSIDPNDMDKKIEEILGLFKELEPIEIGFIFNKDIKLPKIE